MKSQMPTEHKMQNFIILFAGLAVAFGCLWHNRPSRAGLGEERNSSDNPTHPAPKPGGPQPDRSS
jgi:hypothetical protein